jgi:hypothetical protein
MGNVQGIGLLSGGLDSILALHLLLDLGLRVESMHAILPVHDPAQLDWVEKVTADLAVPLYTVSLEEKFFDRLRDPKHGYGSGMNPCLDCRILVLQEARERMRQLGAAFVFTGEVVGERPMSQNLRAMRLVEQESGLEGRLLRPLSAQLLPPTIVEEEGLIDRSRLLAIKGRSRKPQFALAEKYGIADFPTPGGGCLLTDPGFSRRAEDLLNHMPEFDRNDFDLLKVGRQFRVSSSTKVVSGRKKAENERILELAREGDLLFEVRGYGSPITLLRGEADPEAIATAAAITARYSDAPGLHIVVRYGSSYPDLTRAIIVEPAENDLLDRLRV